MDHNMQDCCSHRRCTLPRIVALRSYRMGREGRRDKTSREISSQASRFDIDFDGFG